MDTLRGEPQISEVISKFEAVWDKSPDMSFARIFGSAAASLGLIGNNLGQAIFAGTLKDSDLLWGLHKWMYMARGEVPSPCPYCGVEWESHEWV